MSAASEERASHGTLQKIAARRAYDQLSLRSRRALDRRNCAPEELDRKGRPKPELPDSAWGRRWLPIDELPELATFVVDQADASARIITNAALYGIQVEVATATIDTVIEMLCSGERDRPEALTSALKAVIRGQHYGEKNSAIASAHGAPAGPLRRYLVGLRKRGLV